MNEGEETEVVKTFPSTPTCCNGSRPCPTVSQYQLGTPVMQDTRHLCLTQPPPWDQVYMIVAIKMSIENSSASVVVTNV